MAGENVQVFSGRDLFEKDVLNLTKAGCMKHKISTIGTAFLGLIASATLLSSCGEQNKTSTSPAASTPSPSAASPLAASPSPESASPVVDSSPSSATSPTAASPSAESPTAAESPSSGAISTSASPLPESPTAAESPSSSTGTTAASPSASPESLTTAASPSASTAGEAQSIPAATFESIDVNKAGKVTSEEFVSYYAEKASASEKVSKEDAQKKFKQLDKDNDGSLTKEEATGKL